MSRNWEIVLYTLLLQITTVNLQLAENNIEILLWFSIYES